MGKTGDNSVLPIYSKSCAEEDGAKEKRSLRKEIQEEGEKRKMKGAIFNIHIYV